MLACCRKQSGHKLEAMKKLADYPSASAIEYLNGKIYLLGDDANYLVVLDSNFNQIDSVQLYSFTEKRIPKELKADLEALTIIRKKKQTLLLAVGSGATEKRNAGWIIDIDSGKKDSISLDRFYSRLGKKGAKEINIEGACSIPGYLLLVNRGNKGYRSNLLIKTKNDFWNDTINTPVDLIRIGTNTDTNSFQGASGMDYATRSDRLILTVSTEDTKNSYDDGTIGKSYLWVVKFISSKREWLAINPDQVIDLEKIDQRFKGQKIESVAVMNETNDHLVLLLAADNDDGSSSLFKLKIKKE
jgi:hypothetical protein